MATTKASATYFPHIDGIRSFAVFSVLLFHLFPQWCSGGFIGVDVFFVISGYLITRGLHNNILRNQFSVKQFYVHRIRRIFPAYACMLLLSLLLGVLLFDAERVRLLYKTALSSVFFCTNLFFQRHSGYFDADVQQNPLLNLWSLSVEEQFYVFFPLLLALLHRFRPHDLRLALWGIALVSLGAGSWLIFGRNMPTDCFYGLPYRAWELLAGSLLALLPSTKRTHEWWGIGSLVCLVTAFFIYSAEMPFPGPTALLPVLCGVLLIRYGNQGWCRAILEHPLAVGVGKISYSLYLIHWPLVVYAHYLLEGLYPEWVTGCGVLALSIILSYFSWKWIETPFRRTSWKPSRYFMLAGAGMGILVFCSYAVRWISRNDEVFENYWVGSGSRLYADPGWEENENTTPDSLVYLGKDEAPRYLLWGDSHAMALSPGFHEWSLRSGINGLFVNRKHVLLNKGTCSLYPRNARWVDSVLQWLGQHEEIGTVILVNRWAVRAQGFANEAPHERRIYVLEGAKAGGTPEEIFTEGLSSLCRVLKQMNRRVIILSSIPEQKRSVPDQMKRARLLGKSSDYFAVSQDEYVQRQTEVTRTLRGLEQEGLAKIIWVDGFFYPSGKKRSLNEGIHALYLDDDHLSPTGARLLLDFIDEPLRHLMTEA